MGWTSNKNATLVPATSDKQSINNFKIKMLDCESHACWHLQTSGHLNRMSGIDGEGQIPDHGLHSYFGLTKLHNTLRVIYGSIWDFFWLGCYELKVQTPCQWDCKLIEFQMSNHHDLHHYCYSTNIGGECWCDCQWNWQNHLSVACMQTKFVVFAIICHAYSDRLGRVDFACIRNDFLTLKGDGELCT